MAFGEKKPDSEQETPAGEAPLQPEGRESRGVATIRAMALACALMPVLALWVVQSELIWYSGHSTAISLFFHVTFVIFFLALGNLWIARRWPSRALSPGEIMTVYMMLSIAGTFCSHDLLQVAIPMLSLPVRAANAQNRWGELILAHIPSWAIVQDKDVIQGLAVGNSSIYDWQVWRAWARPLSFWFVFLMALMGALLSVNVFFRQPWTEKERLSFPIIQIPMTLAERLGDLLRSKLFWLAFCLAAFIDIVNGFHFFYPNVPEIPIVKAFEFREYLIERPWDAISRTEINLYPFVIGLVFFIPTDLAFSCWFFFLVFKAQLVLTAALGINDLPGFPFTTEQSGGAYLALGLLAIWLARRHFVGVWRTILGRPGGIDDSREPLRYRTTLMVFLLCFSYLVGCGMALGGTLPVMVLFFIIFLIYAIAIARLRAELGPPAHDLHRMGPDILLYNALGAHAAGKGNIAAFSLFFWFNRAYRAHFSAHSMEGFKIAQIYREQSRAILKAILLAILVGSLSAIWAMLHALSVHGFSGHGAGDAFSREAWTRMASWMAFPMEPNIAATSATVLGLLFALFLGAMRMRFTWWMWHPVGYATCSSWSMEKLWMCLFLGWLAKALITRYGGAQAYRRALPFFIGLVLGEFVIGSLWCIFGAMISSEVYHFWG
ncbi:MAG: hypothetical protein BWZ10_00311 [candidate division BRC1 bacterium ADurb.BinA364]|nr:MAG: hypothetical protein BWZ10_00311 [candidate division BRC1 bacterium ADurb.BinA364]